MHTGAQSAKKDVISTKPQKGRASRGPKKHKEAQPNLLPRLPLPYVAVPGHAILCKQGRQGSGAIPLWSDTGV